MHNNSDNKDPLCLRREQSRGSNSDAGKMDQTWSNLQAQEKAVEIIVILLERWSGFQVLVNYSLVLYSRMMVSAENYEMFT